LPDINFIVCTPFAVKCGGQKSAAHPIFTPRPEPQRGSACIPTRRVGTRRTLYNKPLLGKPRGGFFCVKNFLCYIFYMKLKFDREVRKSIADELKKISNFGGVGWASWAIQVTAR
jgi:hypothetical protein